MLSFSSYKAILEWKKPVQAQSFWRHVLRYRLVHMVVWVIFLIWWAIMLFRYVTPDALNKAFSSTVNVLDDLYMSWLVLTYDPLVGIATNMSWPVIRTSDDVFQAVKPYISTIPEELSQWPKNMLIIDPTASVENFTSYDTLFLVTEKYLVVWSPTDIRVVPFIKEDATELTQVVIDKQLITELTQKWSVRITNHGSEINRNLLYVLWWWTLLFLPLLALSMVLWLSAGMLLITLVSRWVSKLRIRVGFQELFTRLSWSYLPVYIVLKLLIWSNILPWGGIIWYIAMVWCLAIYIVRAEEHKK